MAIGNWVKQHDWSLGRKCEFNIKTLICDMRDLGPSHDSAFVTPDTSHDIYASVSLLSNETRNSSSVWLIFTACPSLQGLSLPFVQPWVSALSFRPQFPFCKRRW